jgi:TrmH family RNA methyltransferase
VRAVSEALRSPHHVRDLFVTDDVAGRHDELLRSAAAAGANVTLVTDRAARALSETVHPQGACAVVDIPTSTLSDIVTDRTRLAVVLHGVADPGNAGTVIRTAAAAGADAIVFGRGAVDPYGAKCVRASAGAILHIPVVVDVDTGTAMTHLRRAGLRITAAALDGDDLFSLETQLSEPTAWLFGAEAHGLDPDIAASADRVVRIPMSDRVESLNLAAAAAVCLYASARAHAQPGR